MSVRVAFVRDAPPLSERPVLSASADVAAFVRQHLPLDIQREWCAALLLDTQHKVIDLHIISVGSLTASVVHPREVFREAIVASAAALIVMHNHPSGVAAPSSDDRALTQRLHAAGEIVGIRLVDHVIVTAAEHFSFVDAGELL